MPSSRRAAALFSGLTLITGGLAVAATAPATANPSGTDLVISEVYGGGGNSGATLTHDFVELYNPTAAPIRVDGWSVQYRSATGDSANITSLCGEVPAGGHYLVQQAAGSGGTRPLPAPDATGNAAMSGRNGVVLLVDNSSAVSEKGDLAGSDLVVDAVGYGTTPTTFETVKSGVALTNTTAATRADGADSDHNANDFGEGQPAPQNDGVDEPGTCLPPPVTEATIAEIQGEGDTSPLVGETVTTRGVVTAAYPNGGLYDFVIQTAGTGGGTDATPGASDGLWVDHLCCGMDAQVGQLVEVTGTVEENYGRTQLVYDPNGTKLTVLEEGATDPVQALSTGWWPTAADREAHEGELLDLSDQEFTVTNNYSTNQYGEIGLATGDRPLISPTEVANPNTDTAGYEKVQQDNLERGLLLDDGSSWDYVRGSAFVKGQALPWIDQGTTARVNAAASLTGPVVLDYGFGKWRVQPTSQVNGPQPGLIIFENTRPENEQPQDVGGDLKLATFNVLNYFNTTGMDFVDSGLGTCSYYYDREGDEVTNNRCNPDGPRGAAEEEDLQRQQNKIVAAINTLDADVVSLEEIENSVKFGEQRDDALKQLVNALNADAGTTRWARVPSPPAKKLPALDDQDVIRTAFIYNSSTVDKVGPSQVLVASDAFANARKPLAQAFTPTGQGRKAAFGVIANHFKSKGSPCDGDAGGAQGNCNESRVAQAEALVDFADTFLAHRRIDKLFLAGDFNAYSMEDPIQVLEDANYTNLKSDTPDEWSYSFDGQSGSLDHVLANDAALADVTGVDVWETNANEAVAFEYSRFNYNITQFYEPNLFRASDHNPELVGIAVD